MALMPTTSCGTGVTNHILPLFTSCFSGVSTPAELRHLAGGNMVIFSNGMQGGVNRDLWQSVYLE